MDGGYYKAVKNKGVCNSKKSLYTTGNIIFGRLCLSARIWFSCSFLEKERNKENKYPGKPPLRCCFCILA